MAKDKPGRSGMSGLGRIGFALVAILIPVATARAQIEPNAKWQQLGTDHFNIIYQTPLDSIARHAAKVAELEHARLSVGLIGPPRGKIDIILADNSDITNGYATPLPSNRVVVWVRPPVDELSLQHYDDWIALVLTHELTHVFHSDRTGRLGKGLRTLFGRVPISWPAFPVLDVPRWDLEGLATWVESLHTGSGRLFGSYHEMVVRTDVLEHAFPSIDRVSGETPIWPGGTRAYIYGSLFMDYIARRYGQNAHTQLIRKTAGSILPPPWRMDAIAKHALGRSFRDLYRDWHGELRQQYAALADSLRETGLTEGERMTTAGRWAVFPRISHDGRRLAYTDENGQDATGVRIIDLVTGAEERTRRNGLGPIAWLPHDSAYVTAQLEFHGRYQIYTDLYVVRNGRERRLTRGARIENVDASSDGSHLVFVQTVSGTNRLVLRSLAHHADTTIAAPSPDAQWALPRWSPDGRSIAVQKWTRDNGHDVVILDERGRELALIRTEGIDAAPAWSGTGRYVLFSSDRTGITNLYAYDTVKGDVHQVTNVLGGAFYPEVSRDDRFIYYAAYHTDGFHIERIAFDTATWRAPMPAAPPAAARPDPIRPPVVSVDARMSEPRDYAALPSLLPRFWLPAVWGDTALSVFVGATTAGTDDVERHAYKVQLGVDPAHGRVAGSGFYTYAGFGNPVLTLEAGRDWDYTGLVGVRDSAGVIGDTLGSYEREDRIALTAAIVHRHWRTNNSLLLGVEGVVFNRGILGKAHFLDPRDELLGVLAGAGFANYRTPALAISPEDGIRASLLARRRIELDPAQTDRSYTELNGSAAAYRSVGGRRFAHNVIALRASAVHRTGLGRGPTDVGGVIDFLPVRGFSKRERVGFTAWTASAEYRLPLALIGRGYRLRPLFIDRVAAAFFADGGNASCDERQGQVYLACPGVHGKDSAMLVSAGFEVSANVAALVFLPAWLRAGVAFPLQGGDRNATFYLTYGPAF